MKVKDLKFPAQYPLISFNSACKVTKHQVPGARSVIASQFLWSAISPGQYAHNEGCISVRCNYTIYQTLGPCCWCLQSPQFPFSAGPDDIPELPASTSSPATFDTTYTTHQCSATTGVDRIATMASALRDVTPYLLVLIVVSTLGPLQFGFHLVSPPFVLLSKINTDESRPS